MLEKPDGSKVHRDGVNFPDENVHASHVRSRLLVGCLNVLNDRNVHRVREVVEGKHQQETPKYQPSVSSCLVLGLRLFLEFFSRLFLSQHFQR